MTEQVHYLDASALLKLVVGEPESEALRAYLAERPGQVTSLLSAVEVPRVAARRGITDTGRIEVVLRQVTILGLDEPIARRAATLEPASLRALDAIHLASALELGTDLGAFVTYDVRLAEAARALGLEVAAPA